MERRTKNQRQRILQLRDETEAYMLQLKRRLCFSAWPSALPSAPERCFELLFITRGMYNTDIEAFAAIHEVYTRNNKRPLLCVFVECVCQADTLHALEAAYRAYFTEYHQLQYRVSLVYMSFERDSTLIVSPVQCLLA